MSDSIRIDKWLWAVRLFKTRSLAAEACQAGRVRVGAHVVKASREVRPGDVVTARLPYLTRKVRVLAPIEKRVGAAVVAQCLEDLTSPEEYARAQEAARAAGPRRPPGAGRPTKRDRRLIDAFLSLPASDEPPGKQ